MRPFLPLLSVLLLSLSFAAHAQKARPADLQPLPEPPPPPANMPDIPLNPEIVVKQSGLDKVEEYRVKGKLYMIRVTPPHGGKPYYLVDEYGNGMMSKRETIETGKPAPMWVIGNW